MANTHGDPAPGGKPGWGLPVFGLLTLPLLVLLAALIASAHHSWAQRRERLRTALQLALTSGDRRVIRSLLAEGAPVDARGENDVNAVATGLWGNDPALAHFALDRGADVNAVCYGAPVLIWSMTDDGVFERMLAAGARVNATDKEGMTALMWAARGGRLRHARLLLERGAEVNRQEHSEGRTALIETVYAEREDIAALLLEHGADPNLRDRWGSTVLDHAREAKKLITGWLKEKPLGGFDGRSYRASLRESRRRLEALVRVVSEYQARGK